MSPKNVEHRRNFKLSILVITLASGFLFLAFSDDKEGMESTPLLTAVSGTVAFNNIGARAFVFTAIIGSGISAEVNMENAPLQLKIGNKYQFINNAGPGHPFQILGNGNTILRSQNEVEESFETDTEVNFQVEGMNITFTPTQNLANQIVPYICGNHSSMSRSIDPIN